MYSKSPKSIAYENTGKDREFNIYTEEFLGGADTYIYMNGELCKDISAVQFSVREQQRPIYSYSSRRYNDVATGVRIVKGLLKIPVRNTSFKDKLSGASTSNRNNSTISEYNPPSWVYNYTPDKEYNFMSSYKLDSSEKSSAIYNIQTELNSNGYNINQTGILDNNTKIATIKYKRDNGEYIVNNNNSNYLVCTANNNAELKIMPDECSKTLINICNKDQVMVIDNINDYYLISYIASDIEYKGYVKKGNITVC